MATTKKSNTIHCLWIPDHVLKFPRNRFKIRKTEYIFAYKRRFFYELLVLFSETEVLVVYSTCTTYTLLQCGAWWWHTAKPPPRNTTPLTHSNKPPCTVLPAPITQWPDAMSQRPPRRTWPGKYPFVRGGYPRDSSPGTVVHTTTQSIPFDQTETGEVNWIA